MVASPLRASSWQRRLEYLQVAITILEGTVLTYSSLMHTLKLFSNHWAVGVDLIGAVVLMRSNAQSLRHEKE